VCSVQRGTSDEDGRGRVAAWLVWLEWHGLQGAHVSFLFSPHILELGVETTYVNKIIHGADVSLAAVRNVRDV
jgi:hypothetical protein